MTERLYGATGDSVARLDAPAGAWSVQVSLDGSGAQCLAVDPADGDTLYVGLRDGGVRRSSDGGQTWIDCRLPSPQVFSVAVSAADGTVYAGTEPSALYRSDDRGESWRELEGLLELPSRPTWSFPPRPWTSHVRWIAPSPHDADVVLAGIELGGLMRSTDGGETWQDQRPGSQPDVHSLAWHPRVDGRAYEAGGGGAAWSEDGGDSWHRRRGPRPPLHVVGGGGSCGSRALVRVREHRAVCSARDARRRPACAHLPEERRRLDQLAGGLPDPMPAMPYALVATDSRVFAGLANGELWASPDRGDSWRACELDEPLPRLVGLAYAS